MRSIREILRLRQCGLSHRQIGEAVHKSSATVSGYLARAAAAKLTGPLPEELDDFALEALLFPPQKEIQNARPEPNFVHMHKELKRKGVTKTLLWQEYKKQNPDGLQFSQFCEQYKKWLGAINVTMRIQHEAGEKVFSDFAGKKLKLTNREKLIEAILESKPHPEQGYRACIGILKLGKEFGGDRLNAASKRALATRAWSYSSVKSILKTGLDQRPLPLEIEPIQLKLPHINLRGASYFFVKEEQNASTTNN